ncbi:unnamed protein product [Prunus armeniaca]
MISSFEMQGSGGSSSKSTSTTTVWHGQEGAQAPCRASSGFQHPRQEMGPSKLGKLKGKTSPSSCLGTADLLPCPYLLSWKMSGSDLRKKGRWVEGIVWRVGCVENFSWGGRGSGAEGG